MYTYILLFTLQAFASLGKDVIVQHDQITVQELLGEGTYAKVFKATLRQEKPPMPVSNLTIVLYSEFFKV